MAFSQSDLDKLEEAIVSGELSVRLPSGTSVTYRSMTELMTARDRIKAELKANKRPRAIRHNFKQGIRK